MKIGTWIFRIAVLVAVVISIAGFAGYSILRSSLPQLEGKTNLPLNNAVTVERDAHGVATITAQSRTDLAMATGFVHAQERYFQMDLLRRSSSGELAALFGAAAVDYDKKHRIHRFRWRAEQALKQLPNTEKAILEAYRDGVNAGLQQLDSKPFEYWLLNQTPQPWTTADTYLVVFSMYLDLQDGFGEREIALTALRDNVTEEEYRYLMPTGSRWDAAIDGTEGVQLPAPESLSFLTDVTTTAQIQSLDTIEDHMHGSNNWAVSGAVTEHGSAILADDMHLTLRVPNIWYKARLKYQEGGNYVDISGVTLPGTPNVIVGSNGHVAWGFTNSYGDWSDVIKLSVDDSGKQYLTNTGYSPFIEHEEIISVAGAEDIVFTVQETQWGPVLPQQYKGVPLAYRWIAHDVAGINLNIINIESATSVAEVQAISATMGVPAQNMMMADKNGNIGWTIAGAIPQKASGFNGTFISEWHMSDTTSYWNGIYNAENYPAVINPPDHRLWTANSRVVGGEMFKMIGDSGYALGARAQQIRDGLRAKTTFTELDLFEIQLDDRAIFLERWYRLLLETLAQSDHPSKTRLMDALAASNKEADASDQGYLLVKQFRAHTMRLMFAPLRMKLQSEVPDVKLGSINRRLESPLWSLIQANSNEHLPQGFDSWQALLEQAIEATITQLNTRHDNWEDTTWGDHNAVKFKHPLSGNVPLLHLLTDMPITPQSGDTFMPRVAGAQFGSSQRLVVTPSREEDGILQMPSSQSGHPLAPYGIEHHLAYLSGEPTPLLPEETKYRLNLEPEQ